MEVAAINSANLSNVQNTTFKGRQIAFRGEEGQDTVELSGGENKKPNKKKALIIGGIIAGAVAAGIAAFSVIRGKGPKAAVRASETMLTEATELTKKVQGESADVLKKGQDLIAEGRKFIDEGKDIVEADGVKTFVLKGEGDKVLKKFVLDKEGQLTADDIQEAIRAIAKGDNLSVYTGVEHLEGGKIKAKNMYEFFKDALSGYTEGYEELADGCRSTAALALKDGKAIGYVKNNGDISESLFLDNGKQSMYTKESGKLEDGTYKQTQTLVFEDGKPTTYGTTSKDGAINYVCEDGKWKKIDNAPEAK